MIHPVKETVFEWLKEQKDATIFDGDRGLVVKKGFIATLTNGAKIELCVGDVVELVEK